MDTREIVDRLRRLAGEKPEHSPEDAGGDWSGVPLALRSAALRTLALENSPWGRERYLKQCQERAERGILWN